jgi:beta-lactamase regulating signal transducer with metallopeptidase domain
MDATLNWLWQGGLVAAASSVMLLTLARASANVRYLVCWAAALLVAALPVLSRLHGAAIAVTALPAIESPAMVALPDAWWTSSLVMLAAWMTWVVVHAIRFASAIGAVRRARARSHAFPPHLESVLPHWGRLRVTGRRATLVVSDAVSTAAVLGWGPPMIAVAPSMVTLLDADELDRILIHEWAHVQRRDDVVYIPQVVVRAIAGWHPALWWLDRRLHVEREIACDEMTVAIAGSPKSYAECLLKLATLRGRPRVMHAAPAALTSSYLRARVSRIVMRRTSIAPVWSRSLAAAMVTILAVMSIGIGGLTLVATAFSTPFVPRVETAHAQRLAPAARPESATNGAAQGSADRPAGRPTSAPSTPESPVPAAQPRTEPAPHPTLGTATVVEPAPGASIAANPDHEIATLLPSVPVGVPAQPAVTVDQPRSPWAAAAAGGTAIGRKSKDAGVATAGFFTRFAKHVAGSF